MDLQCSPQKDILQRLKLWLLRVPQMTEPVGPDALLARRKDPVWIDRILQLSVSFGQARANSP
jgi:hypothetical protein